MNKEKIFLQYFNLENAEIIHDSVIYSDSMEKILIDGLNNIGRNYGLELIQKVICKIKK